VRDTERRSGKDAVLLAKARGVRKGCHRGLIIALDRRDAASDIKKARRRDPVAERAGQLGRAVDHPCGDGRAAFVRQRLPDRDEQLQLHLLVLLCLRDLERFRQHPGATAAIEALEQTAREHASATLQARCQPLRALNLDQQGRMADAIEATQTAIELADACGLEDLAVHSIVDCALRMGQNMDPDAEAMLSRAIPRAERLGSRVLLGNAYWTAGRLAGIRDDWTVAIGHYERALSITRTMDEAAQSAPPSPD
jgi:hypothetical protein